MFSWFQKYQFIINFTKLRGYWVKEHLITMKKETSKIHTKLYCIINKVVRNIIHVRVCKQKTNKKTTFVWYASYEINCDLAKPMSIIPGYGNLNQLVFVNTSVLMSVLAPYPQPFGSSVNTPVAVNTKQRNQLKPTDIKICVKNEMIKEIPKYCFHVNINRKTKHIYNYFTHKFILG